MSSDAQPKEDVQQSTHSSKHKKGAALAAKEGETCCVLFRCELSDSHSIGIAVVLTDAQPELKQEAKHFTRSSKTKNESVTIAKEGEYCHTAP